MLIIIIIVIFSPASEAKLKSSREIIENKLQFVLDISEKLVIN